MDHQPPGASAAPSGRGCRPPGLARPRHRWNARRMDQRVHFVTVATRDLDAARVFYRDGLGWEPLLDVPGEIIFFQTAPGLVLGFFDATKFAKDLSGPASSTTSNTAISGITLAHNVNDSATVDQTIQAAIDAGALLIKAPQKSAFGGYHGHFQDPNGLIWEIAHNPGWRVDESGTVFLS
jgi:uncharacterized protein